VEHWLLAWCGEIMLVVGSGEGAPVFVGRVEELAALDAAFERARTGRPSALLIGGEAGVGKSRLVSEFAGRAGAAGAARVLRGHCLELSAEGLPFAPFTGVLRELVRDLGANGVAALLPGRERTGTGPAAARAGRAGYRCGPR
jgi:predicted ATPase